MKINEMNNVRDYNYRRKCKNKERNRYKEICNSNWYFPTMPRRCFNENNVEYFTQGRQDFLKKTLKRTASKRTRNKKDIADGGHYKKNYALSYIWY